MSEGGFFKKAKRSSRPLKMLIGGPSGSGKTYSSLLLAKGFMGSLDEVGVVDTEQSAALYDNLGEFNVLDFKAPFDPRRFSKTIDMAVGEGIKFLIIDSITKAWDGPGGALDMHEKFGGRYQDWAKVTPIWEKMLQDIVHAPIHIIACTRKKQDYSMTEKNGKATVEKMGMKNILRDGAEYEFDCGLDLAMNNTASINKDRTGIFKEIVPCVLNVEHGKMLREWANGRD